MVRRSSLIVLALCGLATPALAQNAPVKPGLPPALNPVAPGKEAPTKGDIPNVPSTGGTIEFSKTVHEFGTISDDRTVEAVFPFVNRGTGPLEILNTQGSCGCTVPALEKRIYQPGESGEIKVQYNPHNRRGPQHTTVTVTTNDAANRSVILNVKTEVSPIVSVEPTMLALGEVFKGRGKTATVTVTSRDKNIAIIGATPTSSLFDARVLPGAEAVVNGQTVWQYPVEVSLRNNAPVGPVSGGVSLRTSETGRQVSLTVQGEVIGDIIANPPRAQLGALLPGQDVNASINLKSRNGRPFRIIKAEDMPQGGAPLFTRIDVVQDPAPANGNAVPSFTLNMSGTAGSSGGPAAGTIVVTTDLPDEKEFRITYYGFVRATPAPQQPQPTQPQAAQPPRPRTIWDDQPSLLVPR